MRRCLVTSNLESVPELSAATSRPDHLAELIVAAQEDERARIARDLHDDVCQQLSVLAMELQELHAALGPSGELSRVESAIAKVWRINSDIRAVSHRLHPSIVCDLGLKDAVQAECRAFAKRHGVGVNFSGRSYTGEIPNRIEVTLFRIVQEALQNVAKHAQATQVNLILQQRSDYVQLRIEDAGVGFDATHQPRGLGLRSMHERVLLLHGNLVIHSVRGQGTLVLATVPTAPAGRQLVSHARGHVYRSTERSKS